LVVGSNPTRLADIPDLGVTSQAFRALRAHISSSPRSDPGCERRVLANHPAVVVVELADPSAQLLEPVIPQ
jgi:hypothetical protein